MSEKIFDAIDKVSSQGLEAMLNEVIRASIEEHNYNNVWEAKYHLRRLELGLPELDESSKEDEIKKDAWKQLNDARNEFRVEAAEHYKTDGNFAEAASCFQGAGRDKEAIDMLLKEGSKRSLETAAYLALKSGAVKIGLDIMIKKGEIGLAFNLMEQTRVFDYCDMQPWGEFLIRAVYHTVIERIKTDIENQEGTKPKGETIPQLLEGRESLVILLHDSGLDHEFAKSLTYAGHSSDHEIIQMGIDLNALLARNERDQYRLERCKGTEMYLKGKLTGSEDCIVYFIRRAEASRTEDSKGSYDYDATRAIDILKHHGKYNAALEVAERFLPPTHDVRFDLLKKLGDTQKLAAAFKETNNPIAYALALTGEKTR